MTSPTDRDIRSNLHIGKKTRAYVAEFMHHARVFLFVGKFVKQQGRKPLLNSNSTALSAVGKQRAVWFALAALLVPTAALGLVLSTFTQSNAATGIRETFHFQARLLTASGDVVPDGNYNVQFKIYQDGDGALGGGDESEQWSEDWLNNDSNGINVVNGYVSAELGSITAFGSSVDWNQDTLWLSVNIGNTNGSCTPFSSCAGDGELDPFFRLTAVPYALNAGELGGISADGFAQLGVSSAQADAGTDTSIFINKTGASGNILNLQDGGTTELLLDQSANLTLGSASDNGALILNDGTSNTVTIQTAAYGQDTVLSIPDAAGATDTFCLLTLNNCAAAGTTLQSAYEAGNTITTNDSDGNLDITIGEATSFLVDITGTGDFEIRDSATAIVTVADGGATTFQNTTDSTAGFRVLDSDGGAAVFNVDTTNERVGIGTNAPTASLEVNGGNALIVGSGNRRLTVQSVDDTAQINLDPGTESGFSLRSLTNGNFSVYDVGATADRFVIDSSGNVGIGDSAPASKLEVAGTVRSDVASGQGSFEVRDGGTISAALLDASGAGNVGLLQLYSAGVQTVAINGNGDSYLNGGNVGIGTASPSSLLDVDGNATIGAIWNTSFVDGNAIRFDRDAANYIYATDASGTLNFGAGGNQTDLQVQADGDVIVNGGNLGVGTTSPSDELHVYGDIPTIRLEDDGGIGTWQIGSQTNGDLFVYDVNAGARRLTIDAAGEIGIGDTTPDNLLDIEGTVADSSYAPLASVFATADSATNTQNALLAQINVAPGSEDATARYPAALRVVASSSSSSIGGSYLTGIDLNNSFGGAGDTIAGITGVGQNLDVTGTASAGTVTGYSTALRNYGSGTISAFSGLSVGSPVNSGGGTINEAYGAFIANLALNGIGSTSYGINVQNQTGTGTNYGVYVAGADDYALFVDDGISRFDGKVGISDTSPNAFLAVDGLGVIGSADNAFFDIAAGRIGAGSSVYSYGSICTGNSLTSCGGTGGVNLGAANTNAYVNITDGAATNSFFNGGNVGIGTTAPGQKLEVADNEDAIIEIAGDDDNVDGDDGTQNAVLRLSLDSGNNYLDILNVNGSGSSRLAVRDEGSNEFFSILSNSGSTDGYVGIGTSAPIARLQVNEPGTDADDHAYAYFTTGDTGATASDGLTVGYAANNTAVVTNRESTDLFVNSGGDVVLQGSGGNVGVGVDNPSARLEISTSGDASTLPFQITPDSSQSTSFLAIRNLADNLDVVDVTNTSTTFTDGTNGSRNIVINPNGSRIQFNSTTGVGRLAYGSNDVIYISSSQLVGIGSESPDDYLEIGDNVSSPAFSSSDPDIATTIGSTTEGEEVAFQLYVQEGTNNQRAKLFLDDSTGTYGFDSSYSSGAPNFVINSLGSEQLRVESTGDVGIGVSNPDAKLDVRDNSETTGDVVSVYANGLTSGRGLSVEGTSTYTVAAATQLAEFDFTAAPSSASSSGFESLRANVSISNNDNIDNNVTAITGNVINTGSSGTANLARGVLGQISSTGAGTITTGAALYAANPNLVSGTVTNNYGLYIQNQTAGGSDYGVYIQGADTYALFVDAGVTRLDGQVEFNSLATADTDTYLCLNTSNRLVECGASPATSSNAFFQNGNSFGATAVLGTNDTNNLQFETDGSTRLTIDSDGDVGVGTTNPGYVFSVEGTEATRTALAQISPTFTSATNSPIGLRVGATYSPSSAAGSYFPKAAELGLTSSSANIGSASIYGAEIYSRWTGTGTINGVYGSLNRADNTGTGTASVARAGQFQVRNTSTGTISNAYALFTTDATNSGGGTVTNNYGLYVSDLTAGTADYGVRIDGADTQALWVGAGANNTDAANGIAFGSSRDTVLYRSAANQLGTTDSLFIDNDSSSIINIDTAASNTNVFDLDVSSSDRFDIVKNGSGDIDFQTSSGYDLLFNPGGNIGIGTDNPSFLLDIDAGSTSDTSIVDLTGTITSGTGTQTALRNTITFSPSTTATTIYPRASQNSISSTQTTLSPGWLIGSFDQASYGGTGTGNSSTRYIGNVGRVTNTSTGTQAVSVGLQGDIYNTSTGTITAAYALYADGPSNGSGTISTIAGLRVDDQSVGTTGNAYGIWVADQTGTGNEYGIRVDGADTQALWVGAGADNTDAANGIAFGASRDTNLYRSGANQLTTDDNLYFNGNGLAIVLGSGGSEEGSISRIDQLIGYNDLRLRGNAGTTDLYINSTGSVSIGLGDTAASGQLQVGGDEVRIGSGGTLNFTSGDGDLYVQDALEVDGNLYLGAEALRVSDSDVAWGVPYSSSFANNIIGTGVYETGYNVLGWEAVSNIEYYNGSSWVTWSTDLNPWFDNNPNTGVSIPTAQNNFRFVINPGAYQGINGFRFEREWVSGGVTADITIETDDNTSFTSPSTTASVSLTDSLDEQWYVADNINVADSYIRITVDATTTGAWTINEIAASTSRPGASSPNILPFQKDADSAYVNEALAVGYTSGETGLPTNGLRVAGDAEIRGGDLDLGVNDTTAGVLEVHGNATGSVEGGEIRIFTAADHDSTIDAYYLDTWYDNFRIFSAGTVRLQIAQGGNVLIGSGTPDLATGSGDLYVQDTLEVDGQIDVVRAASGAAATLENSSTNAQLELTDGTRTTTFATSGDGFQTLYGAALTIEGSTELRLNRSGGNILALRDAGGVANGVGIGQVTPSGTRLGILTGSTTQIGAYIEGQSSQTADLFQVRSNGSSTGDLFVVDANGNAGISVASPLANLDIGGSGVSDIGLQLRSGDISTGTDSSQIVLGFNGNSYNSNGYAHSIRTRHNAAAQANNAIDFYVWDQTSDTASTLGSLRVLTLDGTGNVGIGTSSPSELLEVSAGTSGDAGIVLRADTDNNDETDNPFVKFLQDAGGITGIVGLIGNNGVDPENVTYTGAINNSLLLGTQTNSGLQLGTNDNVRLTIDTSGNVGIGDTTPTEGVLTISETANSTALYVGQNSGGRTLIFGASGLINNSQTSFGKSGSPSFATLEASTTIASRIGIDIQGVASQTAELLRLRNSSAVDLFSVAADGDTYVSGVLAVGTASPAAWAEFEVSGDAQITADLVVGGAVTSTGAITIGTSDTTGTLLTVDTKTSSGDPTGVAGAIYYNSNAGKFRCYEGGAWTDCVDGGGAGSGGDTRTVTLVPEYPGLTLVPDGTNNTGTMTSDFCSGTSRLSINTGVCASSDEHNYFSWTTTEGSGQDYDIYVRYQMPSDFSAFSSSSTIQMSGWRTDGTTNKTEIAMFDDSGTQCGSTTNVATGTATWSTVSITGDETGCGIAANEMVVFRIRLTADTNDFARAGEISFSYTTSF